MQKSKEISRKEEKYARERIENSPLQVNGERCANCNNRLFSDYVKIGEQKFCARCAEKVA